MGEKAKVKKSLWEEETGEREWDNLAREEAGDVMGRTDAVELCLTERWGYVIKTPTSKCEEQK